MKIGRDALQKWRFPSSFVAAIVVLSLLQATVISERSKCDVDKQIKLYCSRYGTPGRMQCSQGRVHESYSSDRNLEHIRCVGLSLL